MRSVSRLDLPEVTVDPSNLRAGNLWHNTTESVIKFYNGSEIKILAFASEVFNKASNIALVDSVNGTPSGSVGDLNNPFNSINSAMQAVVAGQSVLVLPGTYSEPLITVKSGVSLISLSGPDVTIINGSLGTGNRVILQDSSIISGFTVQAPSDISSAISYSGASTAKITNVRIFGTGSSGIGVTKSGDGLLEVNSLDYLSGSISSLVRLLLGSISLESVAIKGGNVLDGISVINGSAHVVSYISSPSSTVSNNISISGGSFTADDVNAKSGSVGLNITSSGASISIKDCDLESTSTNIRASSGLANVSLNILNGFLNADKFSFPSDWDYSGTKISFNNVLWSPLEVGHLEQGRRSFLGQGAPSARGLKVYSTDSNTSSTSDGGNLVDLSGGAISFQGSTAGHSIILGSDLGSKFWGLVCDVSLAAVELSPNSFAIDYWDGSNWNSTDFFSYNYNSLDTYGSSVFIRTSEDAIHFGMDSSTQWSTKSISGDDLYWVRIRIVNSVSTSPQFDSIKLVPSTLFIDSSGYTVYMGDSRPMMELVSTGNVFGRSGGVYSGFSQVGSGSPLQETWEHVLPDSELKGDIDAVYGQFILPQGLDTSRGLNIQVYFQCSNAITALNGQIRVSSLCVESESSLVADPSGSVSPVPRTLANVSPLSTDSAKFTEVTRDLSGTSGLNEKIQRVDITGFSPSEYYPGDWVLLRIELLNGSSPNQSIKIWGVNVNGYKWKA